MIKKVLIAEDHESANISVQKTLQEMGIPHTDYVYYCDDALQKIQMAQHHKDSYDLLITDLSFDQDHREQQLSGGIALIEAARKVQPELRILVFSAENKPALVETLFNEQEIDGYVRKARGDAKELAKAITAIDNNQRHYPLQFIQQLKQNNAYQFDEVDLAIINQMIEGNRQQEISTYLERNNIYPSGKSSIEKRLKLMKEALHFTTNEQLIAHCVRMGIV